MFKTKLKKTDIGDVPEDWEVDIIENLFIFYANNTLSRDMLSEKGSVYNIHYGDILTKFGSILDVGKNNLPFIKSDVLYSPKFYICDGDLIIADTAEDEMVGKVCEVQNIGDKKIVAGLHTIWLHPKGNLFSPMFMGYFMNSPIYHGQLLPIIQGIKVCSISKTALKETFVLIPNKKEQQRISSVLSDIDTLLFSLHKKIQKKKDIKHGTMQQLLTGKKRLPGFTDPWIEKKLGELGTFISGSGFPMKYQGRKKGIYPFYKVSDFNTIGNEYIMGGANNYIDDKIVGILSCKIVPKNSIIFAKIGAAIYLERKRIVHSDCCIDNNMMAIQIINLFDYAFIYSKLQQIKLGNYATTTALPSLSSSTLSEITLTLPSSIVEQRIIATILSDMDKEIGELEAKLVKYEQVKQGMMQQLLTGKIRLID